MKFSWKVLESILRESSEGMYFLETQELQNDTDSRRYWKSEQELKEAYSSSWIDMVEVLSIHPEEQTFSQAVPPPLFLLIAEMCQPLCLFRRLQEAPQCYWQCGNLQCNVQFLGAWAKWRTSPLTLLVCQRQKIQRGPSQGNCFYISTSRHWVLSWKTHDCENSCGNFMGQTCADAPPFLIIALPFSQGREKGEEICCWAKGRESFWASKGRDWEKLQPVVGNKLDPKARKEWQPELEELHRQQEGRQ